MTLDGFLTFLTLIIAVYAILPNVARLRLRLRVVFPVMVSVIGFGLVIYFEYFSLLAVPCSGAFGDLCRFLIITPESPVSPGQVAFAVVIVWLTIAIAAFTRRRLSPRALPVLSELVSELMYEARYAELVTLIEPHMDLLTRASECTLMVQRLRRRLLNLNPNTRPLHSRVEQIEKGETPFAERSAIHRILALTASTLAYLLPTESRAEHAADEVFRVLAQSVDFTRFVALSRPRFGVQLLACPAFSTTDFCANYLTALISNAQSSLYTEIVSNQNISFETGYYFPEHNRLLHFLFFDAKKAE
jgi:hypothetical protein